MRPAEKLIKQIRETLAGGGAQTSLETLAADYTQLLRAAEQRLESCAEMLAKGSAYQAWQLAQTEPPLLDLLATLRFGRAREWDALLAAHRCRPRRASMPRRCRRSMDFTRAVRS